MNQSNVVKLTINEKVFTAILDNSSSSFEKLLPLTVKMMDLNSNEKNCLNKNLQKKDVIFETVEKEIFYYFNRIAQFCFTKLSHLDINTQEQEKLLMLMDQKKKQEILQLK